MLVHQALLEEDEATVSGNVSKEAESGQHRTYTGAARSQHRNTIENGCLKLMTKCYEPKQI